MNKAEKFMSEYPNLNFEFDKDMPNKLDGLATDGTIYINDNKTEREKTQTIAEELSHYDTTVGNIVGQKNNSDKKQEQQARRLSYTRVCDLDSLIHCYNERLFEPWEIADYLECNTDFLWKAIDTYRETKGTYFTYKGYRFNLKDGFHIRKL